MHRVHVAIATLFLFFCRLLSVAQQTVATNTNVVVPPLVNFSGVLTDLNGKPLTGVVGVTFLLYKDSEGGAPLWMETQNVQPDKTGHYTVMLGSTSSTGLPADIFVAGEAHWLGLQVQGLGQAQEEQPRVLLVSAPYALKAGDAQTLGGLPASAFVLAAPSNGSSLTVSHNLAKLNSAISPDVSGTGTTDYIPLWTNGTGGLGNSVLFQSGTKIGINTLTPATTLDVKGKVNASGGFDLGGNAFAFGSYANYDAFLGFAGNTTTTGCCNTASGYQALASNISGQYNTASGFQALASNTKGSGNTAGSGYQALSGNTEGHYNTANGFQALATNTTGSYNTALGSNANVGADNLTNATAIGAYAEVAESNALVLGSYAGSGNQFCGFNCPNTNVGIGTTTPQATLDVVGNNMQILLGDPGCGSGLAGIGFVQVGGFNGCANFGLVGKAAGDLYVNSVLSGSIHFRNNNGANGVYGADLMTIAPNGIVQATGGFSGTCLSSGAFDTSTGSACNMDLAETYASLQTTEPGDLVSLVPGDEATVRKSSRGYEPLLLGVVSTNPGLVFDNGKTHLAGDNSVVTSKGKAVIALAGRVPVKVSMENGRIRAGDPLTSSSHAGVAMKATAAGKIIGYALAPATKNGKVLMFVQAGYYAAPQLASLQSKLTQLHRENLELRQENASLRSQFAEVLAQVKQIRAKLGEGETSMAQVIRPAGH